MDPLYDVFVSHNGRDKPVVERLCRALLDAGVRPWFDKWDLAPGDLWMQEIERVLARVPAVLVCLGEHGFSAWHEAERVAALDRAISERSSTVIPVLLPGASQEVELPGFLRGRQWTDLRREPAWQAEVGRLAATLTGRELKGPWIDDDCERPYRGLRPFTEADAVWMFGREQEETELLDALRGGERFITVVGASGSGKSSLVRAGVVPAVRTGAIDGQHRWHAVVMRPGGRPCQELALRLLELQQDVESTSTNIVGDVDALEELTKRLRTSESRLSRTVDLLLGGRDRDERLLLVIDQFEELLTASSGGDASPGAPVGRGDEPDSMSSRLGEEGLGLLRNLLHATSSDSSRVRVIITVRADFTGECLAVPGLARQMKRMHFALPPMEADQLREAIRRPALRVGHDVEKALIDALVSATEGQPGRLPLLQHTLDLLWDVRERQQRRLTYAAYDEHVGSLEQSVARRAEEVFARLVEESAAHEVAIRRVLLRLVHLGEGTGDTRRRVSRSELSVDAASVVLDRFIEARLLVTDAHRDAAEGQPQQVVEIAHEALLERWSRLRRWIDDNREVLRLRQEVNVAAAQWVTLGRPADELWRGGRLARSREALLDDEVDLAPNERLFLEACEHEERRRQEEREREQQEKLETAQKLAEEQSRRLQVSRRAVVGVGLVGLMAVVTAMLAWIQYRAAEALAMKEKTATAKAERSASKARAATAKALRSAEEANEERDQARLASLMGYSREFGDRDPTRAALGLLEVGSTDTPGWRQEMVDVLQRPVARTLLWGHGGRVMAASFSPDGTRIVTASADGTARVWNRTGSGAPIVLKGHGGGVMAASFSPDGTRIVTASADTTTRVWNADGSGTATVLEGHASRVWTASFSPDGARIVTASADGTARVWNSDGSAPPIVLDGHDAEVWTASFSPNGTRVVTGSFDHTARVWNADGSGTPVVLDGHHDQVRVASFSPDGTRIVTASEDSTARVWSADGSGTPTILRGHHGGVWAASFSPDGTRIVTASFDKTARVWNLDRSGTPTILDGHDDQLTTASFSPDGTRIVTSSGDKTARVWNADGTGTPTILEGHDARVWTASFSPDGTQIVTASWDDTARVWNADGLSPVVVLQGHNHNVVSACFDSEGTQIVTASWDKTARVWNADGSGVPIALEGHDAPIVAARFSPEGTQIVTASTDKTARVWNVDGTGTPTVLEGHGAQLTDAVFSPDGTRIATASADNTARVWNADGSGMPIVLNGHDAPVVVVRFSPDGTRIVTASLDDTAQVWNADGSGMPTVLRGHRNQVTAASFSPDGTRIVTASADQTARVWNADGAGTPVVFEGHDALVIAAGFSPDGTRIVTASPDNTARVWNADGVGPPIVLQGHHAQVWAASFSPDGSRILTASFDKTARIWNADGSGTPIVLQGHDAWVRAASFNSGGTHILTVSDDETARVWPIADGLLRDFLQSATTACIPADDRAFYLGETLVEAHERFTACELEHGRPAPIWE